MNTTDRNGVALPSDLGEIIDFVWSVRIAATNGVLNSSTGWTYYEIPAEAVIQRSRSTALDEGTWSLTLGILADALPDLTEPLAYYQLEVDLVDDAGNQWPYHTGPIDTVSESWTLDGGALVRVYEVQSFGVLQRTKGFDFLSLNVVPLSATFSGTMTGFAQAHYVTMTGPFAVGTRYLIPGTNAGGTVDITVGTGSFPGVIVDNDSAFGSPLVYGVDYTVTNAAGTAVPAANEPAYLNPLVAIAAGTWYVRFFAVAYWGILQNSPVSRPFFIRVPPGAVTYTFGTTRPKRTIADDFATLAASGCTTTVISVKDPEPYKSGTGVVAVTSGPTEFLEWTSASTGAVEVRQISSVDASGNITVTAFSAAPAEGDLIRLVTTQSFRAWQRNNTSFPSYSGVNPGFFTSSARVTEYPKGLFELLPQSGIMRARSTRHWLTASTEVYGYQLEYLSDTVGSIGADNRLESLYYYVLITATSLYAAGDFETGNALLAYFKNFTRTLSSVDQVLDDIGKDGLPPNGYIHDRPAGKLLVSAFRQKTSPDLVLGNVLGVQIGSLPEPVSSVTVRSVGDPRIITPDLEPTLAGTWTNGQRIFDGVQSVDYAEATSGASVTFRIRMSEGALFPPVSSFEIIGRQGVVEVYAERFDGTSTASRTGFLEGSGYFVLSEGKPVVIGKQELENLFALIGGFQTAEWRVTMKFYDDTMNGTKAAQVYEIRAYSEIETGWSAYLTDDLADTADTGTYPTGWNTLNTEGFGPFWWVRDVGRARSFRYASSDYLKRVLPSYNASWSLAGFRREIVDLTRINQVECRRIAESYLDEYVRQGRTYTVSAILDPRIDLGDTVNVTLGDGSSRDLFVWSIADSGAREDFEATYTLLDYSA
jgi:hypothetical protein